VPFFAYVISRERKATQRKKLQSSVSQVKRSPHAKIQLVLSTFKNGRKIQGMFLYAAFQLASFSKGSGVLLEKHGALEFMLVRKFLTMGMHNETNK